MIFWTKNKERRTLFFFSYIRPQRSNDYESPVLIIFLGSTTIMDFNYAVNFQMQFGSASQIFLDLHKIINFL